MTFKSRVGKVNESVHHHFVSLFKSVWAARCEEVWPCCYQRRIRGRLSQTPIAAFMCLLNEPRWSEHAGLSGLRHLVKRHVWASLLKLLPLRPDSRIIEQWLMDGLTLIPWDSFGMSWRRIYAAVQLIWAVRRKLTHSAQNWPLASCIIKTTTQWFKVITTEGVSTFFNSFLSCGPCLCFTVWNDGWWWRHRHRAAFSPSHHQPQIQRVPQPARTSGGEAGLQEINQE